MREWAAEVTVGEELARRLIRTQFPDVELRTIRPLGEGWDMTVWLVDELLVFRFPRRQGVVPGLTRELAHLRRLAPLLPLPVPVPTHAGAPGRDYPWPFSGAPFLPGRELAEASLDERRRAALARPLGAFLRALHDLRPDADLPLDPFGRTDMTARVPETRARLAEVERRGLWRVPREAHAVVEAAAGLGPASSICLVHGDLHLRHLLVDEAGGAAAVIDWIDLSRNRPGVDLLLYWSLLPPEARPDFHEAYGPVSGDELLCARVVALYVCGTLAVYAHDEKLPALRHEALLGLERTVRAA